MTTTSEMHVEPCGCRYRAVDVPDDMAIGQGWEQVAPCADHRSAVSA